MRVLSRLTREHRRLRACLSILGRTIARAGFRRKFDRFFRIYLSHERFEDALVETLPLSRCDPSELRPLRGYLNIHRQIERQLRELKGHIEDWRPVYVHRSFFQIRLMVLSHLEFEEEWVFPVLRKAIAQGAVPALPEEKSPLPRAAEGRESWTSSLS